MENVRIKKNCTLFRIFGKKERKKHSACYRHTRPDIAPTPSALSYTAVWRHTMPRSSCFILALYPVKDGAFSPSASRPPPVPTHFLDYSPTWHFQTFCECAFVLGVCHSFGELRTHGSHPCGWLYYPPVAPGGGFPLSRFRTAAHGTKPPPAPPRGGCHKIVF